MESIDDEPDADRKDDADRGTQQRVVLEQPTGDEPDHHGVGRPEHGCDRRYGDEAAAGESRRPRREIHSDAPDRDVSRHEDEHRAATVEGALRPGDGPP